MSLRRRAPDPETAALIQRRFDAVLHPRGAHAVWDDDIDDLEDDAPDPGAPASAPPVEDRWQRARRFTRGHLGVVLVVVVVALLLAAAGVARARPVALATPTPDPVTVAPTTPAAAPTATPSSTSPELAVHVLGAVHRPGVVRLPTGARVADALRAAGGLTRSAAPGELNLAQSLADGQQVLIVTRAATERDPPETSQVRDPGAASTGAPAASGTAGTTETGSGGPVNLNTATLDQLDQLPGVGPVTAQRILDWRSAHGRFSTVEELQEVDGIGPKTFARLAPEVTV